MQRFFSCSFGLILFAFTAQGQAFNLPTQPTEAEHPGSAHYRFAVQRESVQINGRKVDVFLPREAVERGEKVPAIVFGHGQGIGVEGYEQSFEHLARKGIAVIHPMYDNGFLDQEWRRMAADFNELAWQASRRFATVIDAEKIVYSGHSKGAYIALMAAGAPANKNRVGALVLFAPAGFDEDYLRALDPAIPVTLAWSDADTIIQQTMITNIYSKLPSRAKQWVLVKSYAALRADHFYPLNRSYFFGGRNGISAFHYFVFWKWLGAAALDLNQGGVLQNPYIYGQEAASTGISGLAHEVTRNW